MNKGKTVLIVDDDKFLLDMYASKFKKSDFEVFAYSGTSEAYEKIESGFSPDIMVLDVIMPGMDGVEFLEKLQQRGLAKNSIVIMLTNQSESVDIERAKKLGVHGYIVKATTIPSEVVSEVCSIYEKNTKSRE